VLGTGCSGTDVCVDVLQKVFDYWQEVFGLKFEMVHRWSCDRGAAQRAFIKTHFAPQAIFAEMSSLAEADCFEEACRWWVNLS